MEIATKSGNIPGQIVEIWQRIVDSASELLAVPSVMINRLEPPDLEVFRSNTGPQNPFPSGTRMPMMGIYCEAAARRRQRLQVTDARTDPEWKDSPTAKAGIFAYLGFPVFWPSGEVFGTLCAVDTKENKWLAPSEHLLQSFKDAVEAHLALVAAMEELDRKNQALERTLAEVRTLQKLFPICASCKKIRDDKGYWNQLERYLMDHSDIRFSHGICPHCAKTLYPDIETD
jgi:GAF domain-containing protein